MNSDFADRDDTNQKIHIVVLNYDPKNGADGTYTQTTSFSDPCTEAIKAKRNSLVKKYV